MPRKLSTEYVKDLFEKYGYIVPDNFKYENNRTKIRVFDEMNEVHENVTLQQLRYKIDKAATLRKPYFDKSLMNIETQPGHKSVPKKYS